MAPTTHRAGSNYRAASRQGEWLNPMSYQTAALLAATSWAVGGLIAAEPARVLGGPRFVRIRMFYVTVALIGIAWLVSGWQTVTASDWLPLAASGFVGLALGDAALFEAFARLGPRRTGILFATNAPMAAIMSAALYGERFGFRGVSGTALVLAGVALAIVYGTRPGLSHSWEHIRGNLGVGVGFGLLGALGQAVGVIIADPVFDGSLNPWAGAAVRAVAGTVGLIMLMPWFERRNASGTTRRLLTGRIVVLLLVSGTVGQIIGKTLVLIALAGGPPGAISVLASLAPVLQLPIIWLVTRQRPPIGAWVGASIATVGVALVIG